MFRKITFIIPGVVLLLALAVAQTNATSPLDGKTIGLDAGHGNGETGAVGVCSGTEVIEADVNLAVRAELTKLIKNNSTAEAYHIAQLPTRKARVADAEENGSDVLISIHHNGSSDPTVDYTRSFVTQKNDKEFATFIHPKLADAFGPDKGIKNDGYGMTVHGSLPGILTESYFITNTERACAFLDYQADPTDTTLPVHEEARAMYHGLLEYFSTSDSGGDDDSGGDNNGNDCPPGKEKKGEC